MYNVCCSNSLGSSPYSGCELHMCDTLCLFIESSNWLDQSNPMLWRLRMLVWPQPKPQKRVLPHILVLKYWGGFWGNLPTELSFGIFRLSRGLTNNTRDPPPFSFFPSRLWRDSSVPCWMFFFLSGWIWGWCIEFPQSCGVNTVSASLKALWTVFCFNVSTLTANGFIPGVSISAPICVRMEKWPVPSVFLLKWNYRSAVCTSEGPHAQNNSFDALIRDNGPSKVLFIRPRSLWRVWLLQSVPLSSWVPPSPLLRLSRHLLFKSLHNSSSARQYPLLCSFFI